MKPFCWAVVGPGRIAQRFAQAVNGLPETRLAWVMSSSAGRAAAFAQRWSPDAAHPMRTTTDLATLLRQDDVDAVYIATPHAHHAHAVQACLEAGKAVLCEKPLVPNVAQALPLLALSSERSVFLMEALWTRFLPLYDQVGTWLRGQAIGPLRSLQSSFCFQTPFDATSRLYDPALAGGAVLDLGVYNLSMARWVIQQALGTCPEPTVLVAHGQLAPTGVDQRVAGTLVFATAGSDTISAQFVCGFDAMADNRFTIAGAQGHIEIAGPFHAATQATLYRQGQAPQQVDAPLAINGFEGEITEAMRCIRAGLTESPAMSHADTLATLGWMDSLRQQMGVRYPFE